MKREKIYVGAHNIAVIECPHCGNAKTVHAEKFRGSRRRVKIRCRCQSTFHVSFEFRKARRKETNLQGYYARLPGGKEWVKVVVTNISMEGIRFLTHATDTLRAGDQLNIRFNLNNEARSLVEKDAVVIWVADGDVGCRFTEPIGHDSVFDTTSGLSLMP